MPLPTPDQYNEAVQGPRLAFVDPALQRGEVERNALGLPHALGGSFAITYRLRSPDGKSYAVRCFHKAAPDIESRYDHVHRALQRLRLPYFVGFEFQRDAIRVRGRTYPIVKMEWAEGETLGVHVERCHRIPKRLADLQRGFEVLEEKLRAAGAAHGDLQNGNVIVGRDGLRLVDYDGMFVPGMTRGDGVEIGHKDFQHPGRSARHFGPEMDRFSFIVLDLTFDALRLRPDLYERYGTGENLLFGASDFTEPDTSPLFEQLARCQDSGFRARVKRFARICCAPVEKVPTLRDFRTGIDIPARTVRRATRLSPRPVYVGALPVVDAAAKEGLSAWDGDRVELVGQVLDSRRGRTRRGNPALTLLLGERRREAAQVTIWGNALQRFPGEGRADDGLEGRWISVTGLMKNLPAGGRWRRRWRCARPVIGVDKPEQIIEIDRDEAVWRLGHGPKPRASTAKRRTESNRQILKALTTGANPARPAGTSRAAASPKARNRALLARIQAASGLVPSRTSGFAQGSSAPAAGSAGRSLGPPRGIPWRPLFWALLGFVALEVVRRMFVD